MFSLKYRPKSFQEFIGHSDEIKNLLSKFPNWPKAFLLIGPPGIGKTSLARLIAKQLDCSDSNRHELDAGQDRGIDKIRELIVKAQEKPLMGKTKVFIIDEAQGLTAEAQQALLKVVEEPPSNTYFIFCSTDPRKIIKALKERCQAGEINLRPMTSQELALIIKEIIKNEKINVTDVLRNIAKAVISAADGIPRRAVMLFDKYYTCPTEKEVLERLNEGTEEIDDDILPMIKCLDKLDIAGYVTELQNYKGNKNYESIRIVLGQIYKKKAAQDIIKKEQRYGIILSMFVHPVDSQLGDIELIYRAYDKA